MPRRKGDGRGPYQNIHGLPISKMSCSDRPERCVYTPSLHLARKHVVGCEELGGGSIQWFSIQLPVECRAERYCPAASDKCHQQTQGLPWDHGSPALRWSGFRAPPRAYRPGHDHAVAGQDPENGSSIRITCGRGTIARASATRCCSPPDSRLGYRSAISAKPTRSSAVSAALRASSAGTA